MKTVLQIYTWCFTRRPWLFAGMLLLATESWGQAVIVENYSALSQGSVPSVMGLVRVTNASKWHGEVRYNYDDARSVSFYGGKTISTQMGIPVHFTPMAGLIQHGRASGLLGLNIETSAQRFEFSLQTTYIYKPGVSAGHDFSTWSELSYAINDWSFSGLTLQHAGLRLNRSTYDPGILLGVQFRQWTVPLYGFNLFNRSRFLMVGVNWEFSQSKLKAGGSGRNGIEVVKN